MGVTRVDSTKIELAKGAILKVQVKGKITLVRYHKSPQRKKRPSAVHANNSRMTCWHSVMKKSLSCYYCTRFSTSLSSMPRARPHVYILESLDEKPSLLVLDALQLKPKLINSARIFTATLHQFLVKTPSLKLLTTVLNKHKDIWLKC